MMRNPALFHGSRRREHGDIYKTKILGGKVIVVHGSVPCKKFLLGDNTLTTTDWPVATRRIMGERSILLQSGSKHASQRRLLGQAFTREAVDGYAPLIESAIVSNLESWAEEGCVKGISAGKDLAFEVAARALIASGDDVMSNETMRLFRVSECFLFVILFLPSRCFIHCRRLFFLPPVFFDPFSPTSFSRIIRFHRRRTSTES